MQRGALSAFVRRPDTGWVNTSRQLVASFWPALPGAVLQVCPSAPLLQAPQSKPLPTGDHWSDAPLQVTQLHRQDVHIVASSNLVAALPMRMYAEGGLTPNAGLHHHQPLTSSPSHQTAQMR